MLISIECFHLLFSGDSSLFRLSHELAGGLENDSKGLLFVMLIPRSVAVCIRYFDYFLIVCETES